MPPLSSNFLSACRMSDLLSTVEELTGAAARVQQRGKAVGDQVNAFIDDYILALEEHRHALLRQVGGHQDEAVGSCSRSYCTSCNSVDEASSRPYYAQ